VNAQQKYIRGKFLSSSTSSELPWNTLMAVLVFISWYFPVDLYRNAEPTHAVTERGCAMFLLVWVYMMWTSTFAHMSVAAVELAEMAENYANLLFVFSLIFCG
jgi:ATP-binding cassette subfamily G (WHITE) protein 2 (PDR)